MRRSWGFRGRALCAVVSLFLFTSLALMPSVARAGAFSDGFETGSLTAWTGSKDFSVQETTVSSGGWAGRARSTGAPSYAWRSLGELHGAITLRAHHAVLSRSAAVWLQYVRTATGGGLVAVGLNAAGRLIMRNIVTGGVATSAITFGPGFHEVETTVVAGASGSVEVRYDGAVVPRLTGQQSLGAASIGRVMVGDASKGRSFDVAVDDVEAAPPPAVDDRTPPGSPAGLTARTSGSGEVELSWSPSIDDVGVDGYGVYRALGDEPFAIVGSTTATSFRDASVAPSSTYRFAIDAYDRAGNRSPLGVPVEVTTGERSPSPDIVMVLTDDQPSDTLDRMPTVSRELVQRGMTFTNGVVSHPLCCPSRVSFLRGQYAHTTGIYDLDGPWGGLGLVRDTNLESSMLGPWLDQLGYRTALLGKYVNGYGGSQSPPPGWDYWRGASAAYYGYTVNEDGAPRRYGFAPADYQTRVLTGYADSFIRSTPPGIPLFLYVAPYASHGPFTAAPEHVGDPRCADATNTDAPAFNEADVSDKPIYIRTRGLQSVSENGFTRPRMQCETLLSVDEMVATILDALVDSGRLGSTLILYSSDNGLANGEHRWQNKRAPYESSVRVPFVVRYDPLTDGVASTSDATVANIDVAPTLLELAGGSVTPGCPTPWYAGVCSPTFDGTSMLPLLEDPQAPWRDGVLLEHYADPAKIPVPTYCGVRTRAVKYVRYVTGEEELYDLVGDPHEMVNMLGDGQVSADDATLRDAMRERLFGPAGWCVPPPPGYRPP